MFADSVIIKVQAGRGGNGALSFRHEKFVERGGPDGGDGGNGGNVIFVADHNLNTLAKFRNNPTIKAKDGESGKHRKQHGKNGEDAVITIPVGTVVMENSIVIADLKAVKQEAIVASGGRGGFGNAHFTSSVRQAPQISELGEPGEEKELILELKLIADVGLVGMPNAGKSTLLSVVSNAKPEIADYPFTTLTPHLGVVEIDNDSFLLADIPGLIEGASQGKGLGDEFLRHLERTMVLLHLIDATQEDVVSAWKTVQKELKSYRVDLSKRPQIVVLTKIDAVDGSTLKQKQLLLGKQTKQKIMAISAVAHKNVLDLLREIIISLVKERSRVENQKTTEPVPVLTLDDDPNAWWIEKVHDGYEIKGTKVSGFARRTDFNQPAGEARLRDIMHKMGIDRELIRLGISMGDMVKVGSKTFKW
jgi:GTP-binding protein